MAKRIVFFLSVIILLIPGLTLAAEELLGPDQWPEGDAALPYIQKWIEANGYAFTVGHTSVSNLSNAEKARLRGLRLPEGHQHMGIDYSTIQDPPSRDSWDWRNHGGGTVVENQASCGSCWAFAGVHAVAAAYKIAEGVELNISEQHIVDCNDYGYGCGGGWMMAVYEKYLPGDYGFVAESCYPYTGYDGSCYETSCASLGHIDSYTAVSNSVASIKAALATGPVASAYTVGGSFDYYTGGCFSENHGTSYNHGMLIVGWDDAQCSGGAWIVKNSWGTGWGIAGYSYIQYGTSGIGDEADLVHYTPQTPVPDLEYASHVVNDSGGDGDGNIDPGETVVLQISLANTGTLGATGVTANLSTMTPGVTFVDNSASFPDIPAGQTRSSNTPHYTVSFSSGMVVGTTVNFLLSISTGQGNFSDSFSITVGDVQTLFFDDMEGGTNGWTHYQVATQDDWMRGYPGSNSYDPDAPYSGSFIWGNDLAPSGWNGNYAANVNNYLRSPAIDCSGYEDVTLKYRRWLTVEQGIYDHATITVNGTQVWQNPSGSDFIDGSWAEHEIDISAIADGNPAVTIEFHLQSDGGVEYGGWNIDDFGLYGFEAYSGPVETMSVSLGCLPASGTLPYMLALWPQLNNTTGFTRTLYGRLSVRLANGTQYSNWRSGSTNVAPMGSFSTTFNVNLPDYGALVGNNVFTLFGADVTASPFNQPPYPSAGDTDTKSCTSVGH